MALGFVLGTSTARLVMLTQKGSVTQAEATLPSPNFSVQEQSTAGYMAEPEKLSDAFGDEEQLAYNGYVISKLYKRVKYDYPEECKCKPELLDVSYAVVTRNNRQVAKFDAGYYLGMGGGNLTEFGMFPFLGGRTKQLVVSQGINRGGTQWVASLFPRLNVVFDGAAWGVGREVDDMGVEDVDGDGAYEITVPITDFYDLQDKMSISAIPLPSIIFRYDEKTEKYLPANSLFPEYAERNAADYSEGVNSGDEFLVKSRILHVLLDKIYAGKQDEGWAFFEHNYKASDKEEIRRRVKSLLKDQPVYKFIYHRH